MYCDEVPAFVLDASGESAIVDLPQAPSRSYVTPALSSSLECIVESFSVLVMEKMDTTLRTYLETSKEEFPLHLEAFVLQVTQVQLAVVATLAS